MKITKQNQFYLLKGNLNEVKKQKLFIFLKEIFVTLNINLNKQMIIEYLIFSENKRNSKTQLF